MFDIWLLFKLSMPITWGYFLPISYCRAVWYGTGCYEKRVLPDITKYPKFTVKSAR